MSVDFLTTIAIGIFAALCVVAIRHFSRRFLGHELPKWLMPVAIALSMVIYSVWNEYSWSSRLIAKMPDSVSILGTGTTKTAFRPWSYAVPMVTRFSALDRAAFQPVQGSPEIRKGEVMLIERYAPMKLIPVAYDCVGQVRADLLEGAQIAPGGMLSGGAWVQLAEDDAGLRAACTD